MTEASSASASAAPPKASPSPLRRYWRAKRRRRIEQLPQSMAIVAAASVCLAGLGSWGGIESWRREPSSKVRALAEVEEWRHTVAGAAVGALWPTGGASAEGGRQLQELPTPAEYVAMINFTNLVCEAEIAVSNETNPIFVPISFEKTDPAAATVFITIVTLYMFLGLAIVCDSFFESALSAICEAMSLKDDVAGATWMAAGGSAPELATSIIAVFVSRSDVGFGTIVGSAVFNVLFVIACCAFVAPNLHLTWWPLARDASFYCYSLALICIFVSDDLQIHVWEASVLLLSYVVYVTIMYYNERLEAWVNSRIEICAKPGTSLQEMLKRLFDSNRIFEFFLYAVIITNTVVVIMEIVDFTAEANKLPCFCGVQVGAIYIPDSVWTWINFGFNMFYFVEMFTKFYAYGFFGYWKVPLNCFDGSLVFLIAIELILTGAARPDLNSSELQEASDNIGVGVARSMRILKFVRLFRSLRIFRLFRVGTGSKSVAPELVEASTAKERITPKDVGEEEGGAKTRTSDEKPQVEEAKEEGDDDDDDDDGPFNPFEIWGDFSSVGGLFGRFFWFTGLPLSLLFFFTIPDCRRPGYTKCWPVTFFMCIFWIGALSVIMVWMVERAGKMYEVPDSIMGIFILAAGTSIPDCLSSVAVARRGHGDMAVSSSIGSNIFDVLIGLPVPWFTYTAILRPAFGPEYGPQWVPVKSEALAVMVLLLFVMVALVITIIHLSKWKLSVNLGLAMMGLYLIFLVVAGLLEGNILFADCNY